MSPIGLENGDTPNGIATPASDTSREERDNGGEKAWIVQKFGGTSVGKLPVNIAEDIVRRVAQPRILIIC